MNKPLKQSNPRNIVSASPTSVGVVQNPCQDQGGNRSGAQITSGAMQMPSYVEANYGASILEWIRQTYDGRMDFGATTTTTVEDLTWRKPLTLREWVVRYRDSVLAVGAQAVKGSLKE
jgi:hypothetical protein